VNVFKLPVSAIAITIRQPAGSDELLILEARAANAALAIALVGRLAQAADGSAINWEALPVSDLDAALLRIRQIVFGDAIRAGADCPVQQCARRIDVSFGVGDYLDHNSPRAARYVEPSPEAGWMRLRGTGVSFRLPTGADQLAVALHAHPERELIRRCIRPANAPAVLIRRVENAMEALSPSLARDLSGQCPECGANVQIHFDPQQFILRELRDQADFIYQDTHLLAEHYHWPEAAILALPRDRRIRYAEMVRASRSAA
jgi:hypothetical protein